MNCFMGGGGLDLFMMDDGTDSVVEVFNVRFFHPMAVAFFPFYLVVMPGT